MFLEIKGIKKHYGEGESRVEVLNGIDIEVNINKFYKVMSERKVDIE